MLLGQVPARSVSELALDAPRVTLAAGLADVHEACYAQHGRPCRYLQSVGMSTTKILAKIETRQALLNVQGILSEADGIIVSRGAHSTQVCVGVGGRGIPICGSEQSSRAGGHLILHVLNRCLGAWL